MPRSFQLPTPQEAGGGILLECQVCHAAGLLESAPGKPDPFLAPARAWPSIACPFTPGCLGHLWPQQRN